MQIIKWVTPERLIMPPQHLLLGNKTICEAALCINGKNQRLRNGTLLLLGKRDIWTRKIRFQTVSRESKRSSQLTLQQLNVQFISWHPQAWDFITEFRRGMPGRLWPPTAQTPIFGSSLLCYHTEAYISNWVLHTSPFKLTWLARGFWHENMASLPFPSVSVVVLPRRYSSMKKQVIKNILNPTDSLTLQKQNFQTWIFFFPPPLFIPIYLRRVIISLRSHRRFLKLLSGTFG